MAVRPTVKRFGGVRDPRRTGSDKVGLEEARVTFDELNDHNHLSTVLGALSRAHCECGDLELAWSFIIEKYELARRMENRQHLADACVYMGDVKRELRDFGEALQHYQEALSIYKETGGTGGTCGATRRTGVIWTQQGQCERALPYLEEALELDVQRGSRWGVGRALFELAHCQATMEDYHCALEHLLVARAIWQKIEHTDIKLAEALLAQICDELGQERFDQMVSAIDISQSEYAEFFR